MILSYDIGVRLTISHELTGMLTLGACSERAADSADIGILWADYFVGLVGLGGSQVSRSVLCLAYRQQLHFIATRLTANSNAAADVTAQSKR